MTRLVRKSSSKDRQTRETASQDDLSIASTLYGSPNDKPAYDDAEGYIPAKEDYVYVVPMHPITSTDGSVPGRLKGTARRAASCRASPIFNMY